MNESHLTLALVFLAVFLPIALWRREAGDALQRESGWKHLPSVYKLLWRPVYLLESTLGALLANMMPRKAAQAT